MSHFFDVYTSSQGAHSYRTMQPQEIKDWLAVLAKEYVALRTSTESEVVPISVEGLGLFNTNDLQQVLKDYVVPTPALGSLSITRSDLSEMASYLILEDEYQTQIGFKLIRDRELIDSPGRGIDVIGIEEVPDENLSLVLTEVKFSDEQVAPPQVVEKSKDSLKKQHLAHLKEKEKTVSKLFDCARKVKDQHLSTLYFKAAILFNAQCWEKLNLVFCSVLVRPEQKYDPKDFGCFIKSPDNFSPGVVRFLILKLPGDIATLLNDWHGAIETECAPPKAENE